MPRPRRAARAMVVLLLAAGCAPRQLDATRLDPCTVDPAPRACGAAVWPNEHSRANSDPWLSAHHDELTLMRPRVLVLHFYNGLDLAGIRAVADRQAAALREGSRYHAYWDSAAPAFLDYQVARVVDLTDHPAPADWPFPSSTKLPVKPDGSFDMPALFSASFAEHYGYPDPQRPGQSLPLCALFERGLVNEVWLSVEEPGPRQPLLVAESKQVYDAAGAPVPDKFEPCAGSGCVEPEVRCAVTVRVAHLSPIRGPGCDLQIRAFGVVSMMNALPYLDANARPFFNRDFKARFGTTFDGWSDICDNLSTPCVTYPDPARATGTADGTPFELDLRRQGCGTSQFPPNARFRWDYDNTAEVLSRCEHYGLRDGPDGNDLNDSFSSTKVKIYDQQFPDCGGGWQMYWRQSLPGLNNAAVDAKGGRMKNWWPYLFY